MAEPSQRQKNESPRRRPVIAAGLLLWAAFAAGAVMASCTDDSPLFPSSSAAASGSGGNGGAGGNGGDGGTTTASGTGGAGGSGAGGSTPGAARVITQHNDNARTGANLAETVLDTSNVTVSKFGMLFRRAVDDQIYAQPLYVPGVEIPGKGVHNVVYVATMNDSIYAFDADDPAAAAPLWHVSFIDPANGVTPVTNVDVGFNCGLYKDISGNIGILSTPVIDEATGTLYAVAKTKENGGLQVYRLHALDITTGAERPGSPVVVQATVPGTGDGSDGTNITFDASIENQRTALTLANGNIYFGFASYCDTGPYHGWLFAYDKANLAQKAVYNDTPNGWAGGIWMSGQGVSVDSDGNVYLLTGNGTFTGATAGGKDHGSSILKMSPSLALIDWFTPFNVDALNNADLDLGSAGALLMPGTNLLVGGGKGGYLYVLDRSDLGHWNAANDSQIVQSFQVTGSHIHGSPIVWSLPSEPLIYVWGEYEHLISYKLQGGQFVPTGQSILPAPPGMPGGVLSLSADGTKAGTGIVWATHPLTGDANQAVRPGILKAFDASNVGNLLWDSQQNPTRDDCGNFAKFNPTTIVDGKVFLASFSNQLCVYGLGDFSGPCYNGVQDQGETGVDCGGPCAPCVPHVFYCPTASISVGETRTCDLGAAHPITSVGVSMGCNDGEMADVTLTFDTADVLMVTAACNTSFAVNSILSQYAYLEMTAGGGADNHISFQDWTITYQ